MLGYCHGEAPSVPSIFVELLKPSDSNLRRAGQAIASGLLVAIPTETVYGLGANAFDPRAVARVFEAKARPTFDPLIVHIARLEDLDRVARTIPPKAEALARALWPGPLTLVLPKRSEVPDLVTSGLDTVAVRLPSHPLARLIVQYSGTAVAAPSANPFGYISPTTAEHVAAMLGDKVDFIVDGGPCEVGVESTVVDLSGEIPRILRHGGMPLERIAEVVGEVAASTGPAGADGAGQGAQGLQGAHAPGMPLASPGQLLSHYAPRTRLVLCPAGGIPDRIGYAPDAGSVAIVLDSEHAKRLESAKIFDRVFSLSEQGDLREAAARLFALLHELDSGAYSTIYAERVPDAGLGRAINDRLSRASARRDSPL